MYYVYLNSAGFMTKNYSYETVSKAIQIAVIMVVQIIYFRERHHCYVSALKKPRYHGQYATR